MSKLPQFVIEGAKEPSSMASLAERTGAFGFNLSDEMLSAIMGIVGGVAAITGIFRSEGKSDA